VEAVIHERQLYGISERRHWPSTSNSRRSQPEGLFVAGSRDCIPLSICHFEVQVRTSPAIDDLPNSRFECRLASGKAAFEVVDQACAAKVGGGEDDEIVFIRLR
jgi:hypothetical protein